MVKISATCRVFGKIILPLLRVLYTLEDTEDILQFLAEGLWQRTICEKLTQGTEWTVGTIHRATRTSIQLDKDKVIRNFSKFVYIERNEQLRKIGFICGQFKVKIAFQIGFLQQRWIGWKKLKGITMVVKFVLQNGVSNFQNCLVVNCFMIIGLYQANNFAWTSWWYNLNMSENCFVKPGLICDQGSRMYPWG